MGNWRQPQTGLGKSIPDRGSDRLGQRLEGNQSLTLGARGEKVRQSGKGAG